MVVFFVAACIASGAEARGFNTTVSGNYTGHGIQIVPTTAPMNTGWFVERTGGRVVWSDDATIGYMTHNHKNYPLTAHATYVIRTTQLGNTHIVNINAGTVHVTSWYPFADQDRSEQCHVFETGVCNCAGPHWHICGGDTASTAIRQGFIAAAQASRLAATQQLQDEGVTVTNHP
jgi:hypothetical protein